MKTFDIHLDVRVHDTDDHEYEIQTLEIGESDLYIVIEPTYEVYTHTRMDDGPTQQHVDVYKTALLEHDGDVTEALRALYVFLMYPNQEGENG